MGLLAGILAIIALCNGYVGVSILFFVLAMMITVE